MIWMLSWLLACHPAGKLSDDSACLGPTLPEFAAEEASIYADWLYACPNPLTTLDHDETEVLVEMSWNARSEPFDTCRAQECLETLQAGLPTCSDDGGEWLDISVCAYDYVMP